ncbi:efflux RND transporter permease subunit [Desulfosediminicola ganghwensis]|uniref:efflux RND transporter permease subunit n=1 Tax=Desulfosediminicola ganghwensis TaxID=2569540 RepID=UPI0010AB6939|nr:efflux RND transporter permease subunit [Desulfosediminicola ganghwensis]
MIISDTAVKKSTTVAVLAVMLIIFGAYSYKVLPRESDPDITIPNVFVSTSYRGVSPSDIETSITIEIEKKLKGLEGLKKLQSVSSEGLSSINVEFVTGTDIDQAIQDVKDKVDEALGELPSDLEDDPSVFEVNFSEMPIVVYSLSGTCGLPCLKDIADDLKDDIEGVTGVLEVEVTGGLEREIRVEVHPEKLAYYGLNIGSLQQAVESENQNTSGGNIRLGSGRFQLRVPGEFETPEEIYGLIIGTHQGQPVYLKDVAQVVDGFKEEASRSRLDGRSAVNITVKKRSGENIISISKKIDEIISEDQASWPSSTKITKVMDKSRDIELMVADLENNILSGLVLVMIVIFFAMGIRNALLVGLAIPFSMLLSFTALYLMGITLNMVVLFSLTLALGMLVDNAIVIVENIYRFMEQGVGRVEAAMRATSEVAYPVIGSTLTTLAAFSPLLFWPGIMGEFMSYLPLTLIVTLSASLFVAMVINPAMASIFMKVKSPATGSEPPKNAEEVAKAIEQPAEIEGFLLKNYSRILRNALDRPFAIIGVAFCILIVMFKSWQLVIGLEKPVEFFPEIEPKGMYVNIDVPEGADLDYIDKIIERVEFGIAGVAPGTLDERGAPVSSLQALSPKLYEKPDGDEYYGPSDLKNIKNVYTRGVVSSGGSSAFSANTPNHIGVRFLELDERWRSSHDTVDDIRARVRDIAGGEITIAMEEEGPPTGSPINIEISGDDFAVLGEIAKRIKEYLVRIPHVEDVRDDFVEGIPSVQVIVDRQKAALFGLTTDGVGFALKSAYNGLEISSYREGDEDYDITLQLQESDRKMVDILHELMLPTPSGQLVPLSTIAEVTFAGTIGNINRIDNERVVTVKANVNEIHKPGPVAREEAEELLKQFHLPPGYKIKFTGEFEFQQESEDFLTKAFAVALLLIFLILVSMFNSVSQPFIIMTSVILSLGGAFLGLTLFKSPFGIIMTGVGVISLAGVVVNNAIVLIDYTNKLRERGYALRDAVISAGATRLRPVLLTAITTILGLIPMVTGISYDFHSWSISWVSESSQWWRSMAVVVIFGLIVSTFLTLVVVPTLYYLISRFGTISQQVMARLRYLYWKPYYYFAGEPAQQKDKSL